MNNIAPPLDGVVEQIRTELPPTSNQTFEGLLSLAATADDLCDQDIDWAKTLGDNLRDKVDGIDFVLATLKHRAKFWKERADPMNKRAAGAKRNYDSLRDYLASAMDRFNFHSVSGQEVRFQLHDSQPSLEMTRPGAPTDDDYQKYPQLIEPIHGYRWKPDAIKDALLSGKLGQDGACEFARITVGKFVKPYPVKPELPPKKKAKQ